ncbi:MAG: sulfotransferase [Bacteroidetes bacterium]|nr:sulfotransferase [Bacteroidota bacterium]
MIDKPDDINIHFILGSGRSGTTLLFHMLNNHENCVATPELKHLLYFYKKHQHTKEVSPQLLSDINYFAKISKQADDMLDYYDYSNASFNLKIGEKINYFELCRRVYFIFAHNKKDKTKINTIIDKNPTYTLQVDTLSAALPQAKFLYALRDYRSYVLSNIQSKGYSAKNLPIQYHALVWRFYNKLVLALQKKYPDKSKIVWYENLVKEKEKTFQEICLFFNIPYDEQCFDFQQDIAPKTSTQRHERISNKINALSKPINTDRVEAWKKDFNASQLKTIEFWCAKTGEKFGYKPTQKIKWYDALRIIFLSIPYYPRVWLFFQLKSVRLDFYLNEGRRAVFFNKQTKT